MTGCYILLRWVNFTHVKGSELPAAQEQARRRRKQTPNSSRAAQTWLIHEAGQARGV